jgi:hypothetical protein
VHLDAHHLREAPVAHFFLNQAEQVLGVVVLVDLEVGVPGDPEDVAPQDLDSRKERLEVHPDPQLERCESMRAGQAEPSGAGSSAP